MHTVLTVESNSANESLDLLHEALIAKTLANAYRTPFYRKHWGATYRRNAPTTLDGLPITYRRDLELAGETAQVRDGQICREKFTTGTTGNPFPYAIGQREQGVLTEFYDAYYAQEKGRTMRRAVRFHDTHVTFERSIPVPIRFHELSVYGVGSFEYARTHVLDQRHNEDGIDAECSLLVAGERILRAFTDSTCLEHPDGFASPLSSILTYSTYLTPRARHNYERYWGATVIDRYGLAESVGGATEDPNGWYLFDPVVIPEVVGARTHQPVQEGVGVLVLTPLYPFQEAQPLVRYWTDDVVEVSHQQSTIPGRLSIRPLGRASSGILAPHGDQWHLTPQTIFEVLDERSDVMRAPLFGDSPQVIDPHAAGLPISRLNVDYEGGRSIATLHVAVAHSGFRQESLLDDIGASILAHSKELATACHAGECEFRVVSLDREPT